MRTIKFRAWDKKTNKMYHFDSQWLCEEYTSLAFRIKEEQECGGWCFDFDKKLMTNFMQFTGLQDKNGTDVYEGDVVRYDLGEREEKLTEERYSYGHVVFEYGAFCVIEEGLVDYLTDTGETTPWEVIGNIYQNPELLK